MKADHTLVLLALYLHSSEGTHPKMLSKNLLTFASHFPINLKTELLRNAWTTYRVVPKIDRTQQGDELRSIRVLNFHADIGPQTTAGSALERE